VLEYAVAAARRAPMLHAHRQARAQYARARRFADALAPVERAGLLDAYAYECYLTEAVDDAIAARQEALRIWRERGDDLRIGSALGWLSRCYWYAGRNAEAEAAARGALDILEALPPGRELALDPLLRERRQEERRTASTTGPTRGHPEGRPAERPPRRLHQQGVGPGPVLLRRGLAPSLSRP
jgi:hypothetical protein